MDGAAEKIDWFLNTADRYGLKVLLDVHAVKGSQNGFDNSGKANQVNWIDELHFDHWSVSYGEWMGPWNGSAYDYIQTSRMSWALDTVSGLLDRWGSHPAVYALEPVNEPWWSSDMALLKGFYRDVHAMIL